jgi:Bacterial protein of unknown function (DUF839)
MPSRCAEIGYPEYSGAFQTKGEKVRRARFAAALALVVGVTATLVASAAAHKKNPGFKTSQAAMLTPVAPGWTIEPLITVGETLPGTSYKFESIPDGIALRAPHDHGWHNGHRSRSVDVFVNHETSTVPFPFTPATGVGFNDFTNAMVSKLTLNGKTGGILEGRYVIPSEANYQRFCSNFLATREHGFSRPILFTNEEALDWVNRTGTAWPATIGADEARQSGAVVAYDVKKRRYHTIWGMGRHNHENSVAIPGYKKRVVLSTDDTFVSNPTQSQLYSYIAKSTNHVLRDKGDLYAFVSDTPGYDDYYDFAIGSTVEINGHFEKVPKDIATGRNPDGTDMLAADKGYPAPPDDGTWQRGPDGKGLDGPQWVLEHWGDIQPKPAFQFVRLEDVAYDRHRSNVVYIADTGRGATSPGGNAFTSTNGRIWKLVLDRKDPTKAKLSILIEGDDNPVKTLGEIHQPDNVETTKDGLFVTEDPGSSQQFPVGSTDPNATTARLWHYGFRSRAMTVVAKVDQAADEGPTDVDAATAPGNLGAWESSGIVDASKALGRGTYLIDVQAGTLIVEEEQRGTLTYQREGGQLLVLRSPEARDRDRDDDRDRGHGKKKDKDDRGKHRDRKDDRDRRGGKR